MLFGDEDCTITLVPGVGSVQAVRKSATVEGVLVGGGRGVVLTRDGTAVLDQVERLGMGGRIS